MQKGTVIQYDPPGGRGKVFRIQYRDASGKQVKETLGHERDGWTKRKAQAELHDRINAVAKKGYRKPKPIKFEDYAERWFNESQRPLDWKPATIVTYRCAIKRLNERFGSMRLGDIRRSHVNSFANELQDSLAARTVNLTLTVLHMILDRAVNEELIQSNPASRVNRPKEPRYQPRPLSASEARAVESKIADPTVRLAFVTFELLGIRISELRRLRWRNIDFLNGRLRVEDSKTPTGERSISIPPRLLARLQEHFQWTVYRHESDYVFCHPEKGSKMNPERYRKTVKEAVKATGIHDRFRQSHDLRVTSATSGILANENPVKLMTRNGWTSYETAKKYIDLAGQVFPEEAERLEALRLGVAEET